jgi:hypothetical protein
MSVAALVARVKAQAFTISYSCGVLAESQYFRARGGPRSAERLGYKARLRANPTPGDSPRQDKFL